MLQNYHGTNGDGDSYNGDTVVTGTIGAVTPRYWRQENDLRRVSIIYSLFPIKCRTVDSQYTHTTGSEYIQKYFLKFKRKLLYVMYVHLGIIIEIM